MNDKQNLVQMLAKQENLDFAVEGDSVVLKIDDNCEVYFVFDNERNLRDCWRTSRYGATI